MSNHFLDFVDSKCYLFGWNLDHYVLLESKDVKLLQVSRLIEMQSPLYLKGVRFIHPYYQGKEQGSEMGIHR